MPVATAKKTKVAGKQPTSQVMDNLLKSVEDGKDPLESVPEPLRLLHMEKRILIVDDFAPTAKDLKEHLKKFYRRENGCVIDIETDSEKAVKRIKEGEYDVVVLDLMMKKQVGDKAVGLNGDEVLRKVLDEGVFTNTVIYSGDWSDPLRSNIFHQLEGIRNETELEATAGTITEKLEGVPITAVEKYKSGVLKNIIEAIDAVQLVGKRMDEKKTVEYLKTFEPAEVGPSIIEVARMVETAKIFAKRAKDFVRWVQEEQPALVDEETLEKIGDAAIELKEDSDYEEIRAMNDEMRGVRMHSLKHYIGQILYPSDKLMGPEKSDIAKPWFKEFESYHNIMVALYNASLKAKNKKWNLNDIITENLISEVEWNGKFLKADEDIKVFGNTVLMAAVAEQPILNALNAVEGIEGGTVVVTLGKRKLSETKKPTQEFFKEHDVEADGEVAFIEIEDNGPGISKEDLPRITEPDYTKFLGGTGFGLSFLAEKIARCPGAWEIESKVGKGTKVTVYFKLAENAS